MTRHIFTGVLLMSAPFFASASFELNLTAGLSFRTEAPDTALIGKSSVNPDLCRADDCLAPFDPAPTTRFAAAPGSYSSNTDDANLAYERGDVVASAIKAHIAYRHTFFDGFTGFFRGYGWVDPYTRAAHWTHPNTQISARSSSEKSARFDEDRYWGWDVMEAGLEADFFVANRAWALTLGRQKVNWGASTFITRGGLQIWNPADANALSRPGAGLSEAFRGIFGVRVAAEVSDRLAIDVFAPLEWRPYGIPYQGALHSFFDLDGSPGSHDVASLTARAPYDPQQLQEPSDPLLALVSDTSFHIQRSPNVEPKNGGQFGIAAFWRAGAATLGAYWARAHATLPVVSAQASAPSCARAEGNAWGRDARSLIDLELMCGFGLPGAGDLLPLDSARIFLEYPSSREYLGLSLEGQIGQWFGQAELSHSPNEAVQVDLEDLLFAALQPAFPRHEVHLTPAQSIPSSRQALPDFITVYRGDLPGEVKSGSTLAGYESFSSYNITLSATRTFSPRSWFDQGALIAEWGGHFIPALPDTTVQPFEGPGTFGHPSPGFLETGNPLVLNPYQSTQGYVTRWSTGVRLLSLFVIQSGSGSWQPSVFLAYDIQGVSPGMAENHQEGRLISNLQLTWSQGPWMARVNQVLYAGPSSVILRDRDQLTLAMGYTW